MNIILFNERELRQPLPRSDPRSEHILSVLKMEPGQSFDVGLINGPRGKAWYDEPSTQELRLHFTWEEAIPKLYSIDLWVSFSRPQTCRRILQECTSIGVRSIRFFDTEKCEPSYRKSKLWTTGEANRLLIRGAEQAFCTQIPELLLDSNLIQTLENTQSEGSRLALDNYESSQSLATLNHIIQPITLAVGGERGWSNDEREGLRANGFTLVDLDTRVLRTDTACIAALAILKTQLAH